ncbi:uncharacterized protein LOC111643960 [Copidosoma floridanum]|uniref:uncharacterized protein LOC111643960 n=1 Tax=Copidosoma floridanum TaxID=29053 RepID=UPI000C6FB867|nr:uncharacterized protein LOC111643960 [Copidosoma floridanum]
MLLQSLWLLKISWDTPLPDSVVEPWVSIRLEIHGFADASKSAYAAVVYTRMVVENVVHVSLQIAKTRVAPLKVLSIPRLELCGAHLLAKVVRHFTDSCPYDVVPIHLWTDSLNVLHWLNAPPSKWPVFVANRCSDIHHLMLSVKWHHISSKQNPADLSSRGILPSQLIAKQLWFHGPDVLHETDSQYPDLKLEVIEPPPSFNLVASCSEKEPDSFVTSLLSRCSHWFRLTRVTAYVLRFAYRCLGRLRQSSLTTSIQSTDLSFIKREAFARCIYSSLTTIELESASLLLIFDHQQRHFAHNIAVLRRNANLPISQQEHLPASSRLRKLAPFLSDGLLRVGGRLSNALLDSNAKHPLILFGRDSLTLLLVKRYHLLTLHGGNQITLTALRRKYWVLNGRQIVSSVLSHCLTCRRYAAQPQTQLMADLPAARVTPSPAFLRTGVDYAGPFPVRLAKHRGKGTFKGYVAVFICMVTRAVHLEVVEDYTADSFIAAFLRFTSRRGQCSNLCSDRGTNFVGADREMSKMLMDRHKNVSFADALCTLGTQWHFNPPLAPHFGGLWEAAVKSTKFHLKRVIGNQPYLRRIFHVVM